MTTRRDVLRGLSGLAIISTLPGCGGGDDPGTDAGHTHDAGMDSAVTDSAVTDSAVTDSAVTDAGICSTVTSTVAQAGGHGHNLMVQVSASDVAAAVEKMYTLTSTGGHTHVFTLTSGNFAAGTPVMKASGSGGSPAHTHDVTVTCPA